MTLNNWQNNCSTETEAKTTAGCVLNADTCVDRLAEKTEGQLCDSSCSVALRLRSVVQKTSRQWKLQPEVPGLAAGYHGGADRSACAGAC